MLFNGKSEKDFGLFFLEKQILPPSKKKIKEEVPFMNGFYDFSTIGTNGEIIYSERKVSCRYAILESTKIDLHIAYSNCLEWLVDVGKQKLEFDDIPNCYFMAEVEEAPSWKEVAATGEINVVFVCEPFKYSSDYVGQEAWDTFRFDTDFLQDTIFNIAESKTINIFNSGRTIIPLVQCSNTMVATLNGYSASFKLGENKDYKFKLLPGDNQITISGNGDIEFIFRKELL